MAGTVQKSGERYRMLYLIASMKLGQKAQYLLAENGIPVQLHIVAQGTASGEIADMLGVGSTEKAVIMTILPKSEADSTLALLRDTLYLGHRTAALPLRFRSTEAVQESSS